MARDDELAGVEVVLFGILNDPAQGASAVLHRRRRKGDASQAILHVHNRPSHLQVWKQRKNGRFLGAAHPAAAVNVNERGAGAARLVREIEVQLGFPVIGRQVRNAGNHAVLVRDRGGPGSRLRKLGSRDAWKEKTDPKRDRHKPASVKKVARHNFLRTVQNEIPRDPLRLRVFVVKAVVFTAKTQRREEIAKTILVTAKGFADT